MVVVVALWCVFIVQKKLLALFIKKRKIAIFLLIFFIVIKNGAVTRKHFTIAIDDFIEIHLDSRAFIAIPWDFQRLLYVVINLL